MSFYATVVADSLSPSGKRITTIEARYPRFIHSELLTHRAFARNSASSRAIPWPRMMTNIEQDPVVPILWGSEQKGMQTGGEIDNPSEAERIWIEARDNALRSAQALADLGVHKSLCNRLTEPWMWITVIVTATEWNNFFRLRCHPDAEIHFQRIARLIREARDASAPRHVADGDWHMPYIQPEELELYGRECLKKASVARCARVSYRTFDGNVDVESDLKLFEKLIQGSGFGHYSPHEHVAMAIPDPEFRSGPFLGWEQFRKHFRNENLPG